MQHHWTNEVDLPISVLLPLLTNQHQTDFVSIRLGKLLNHARMRLLHSWAEMEMLSPHRLPVGTYSAPPKINTK